MATNLRTAARALAGMYRFSRANTMDACPGEGEAHDVAEAALRALPAGELADLREQFPDLPTYLFEGPEH